MALRTLNITHANGDSETYSVDREKFIGVRQMTVDGNIVNVEHTAKINQVNRATTFGGTNSLALGRDVAPLLKDIKGNATIAYSLRDLNDSQSPFNVVNIRRASDSVTRDFTAKDLLDGTLEDWLGSGVDGHVVTWYDQSGNGSHLTQPTPSSQPKIEKEIRFSLQKSTLLPDAAGSASGLGFTVTGIAHDSKDDVLWAVNLGDDIEPVNTIKTPSLVKLSPKGETKLDEIDLVPVVGGESIQGIAYDSSDDTLWLSEGSGSDVVYHINKDGTFIETLNLPSSSGITYDSTTDTLWTCNFTTSLIKNYTKTGTEISSNAVTFSGIDMLAYHKDSNTVWASGGGNGTVGFIRIFDIATSTWGEQLDLADITLSVEGIAFVGNQLMVADDGYFHQSSATNTVQCFNYTALPYISFDSSDFFQVSFVESLEGASTQIAVVDFKNVSTSMSYSGLSNTDRRLGSFRSNGNPALNAGASAIAPDDNFDGITLDFAVFDNTVGNMHLNGEAIITDSPVGSNGMSGISVGKDHDGSPTFQGLAYEFIFYPTNDSSNRVALETNINDYYLIY